MEEVLQAGSAVTRDRAPTAEVLQAGSVGIPDLVPMAEVLQAGLAVIQARAPIAGTSGPDMILGTMEAIVVLV